jgi:2-keto-4-pentenoate hydratase
VGALGPRQTAFNAGHAPAKWRCRWKRASAIFVKEDRAEHIMSKAETTGLSASLLEARRTGRTVAVDQPPADEAAAYPIQHEVSRGLGEIGGWKVGATGPEGPPNAAPLPASAILGSPARLDPAIFTDRLVESEIAFRISHDLPPRDAAYSATEILAAIGSCHPVIEVVQYRISDHANAHPLTKLADNIGHGALILGAEVPSWREIDFATLAVEQQIGGGVPMMRVGNPAGDMTRLIIWLANQGAVWAGGLRAGQIVTCGSWTGAVAAQADASVMTRFNGLEPVQVSFTV